MERPVAVANWKTTRAKPCALRITSIDSTFAHNRGSGNSWRTGFPMITTASSRFGGSRSQSPSPMPDPWR